MVNKEHFVYSLTYPLLISSSVIFFIFNLYTNWQFFNVLYALVVFIGLVSIYITSLIVIKVKIYSHVLTFLLVLCLMILFYVLSRYVQDAFRYPINIFHFLMWQLSGLVFLINCLNIFIHKLDKDWFIANFFVIKSLLIILLPVLLAQGITMIPTEPCSNSGLIVSFCGLWIVALAIFVVITIPFILQVYVYGANDLKS